ncbi:MAG: hypothetical protein ACJAWL_003171 [Motiliproteus sp.]|jgi:hypothetical protein
MKFTKALFFIPLLAVLSSAQAALPPELEGPLDSLTIYSGAAITLGASSTVGGNIQAKAAGTLEASTAVGGFVVTGAAVTLGATVRVDGYVSARDAGTIGQDSTVGGSFTTGDAATLGATTLNGYIMVDGDLKAGAAILVGAKSVITGNLRSGALASAGLGANAIVGGDATAGTALTLGPDAVVDGHAQAGTGAIELDVRAAVKGNATAGTSVTLADQATVGGTITKESVEQFTNAPKEPVDDQSPQLSSVQAELAAMEAPAENQLLTSMTVDKTLTKGVYHTTALTTTAGVTLTFDGQGGEGHWLINSDSFIAFGADTKMVLKNVVGNSTITWNTGSYTSTGARTNLIGTFFAGSYILTGLSTTLKGIGGACGGLFTNTGAVSLGASNEIGPTGCTVEPIPLIDHYQIIHDGQGLTCEAETVTINACTNADWASCTLSTDLVTLDVNATGADSYSVTDSLEFTGTAQATIAYTRAEPTLLSLGDASIIAASQAVCSDGSTTTDCNLVFADAGFRFLNSSSGSSETIPNQISGTSFPLRVQAVENDEGACVGLFSGNTTIGLSQENVEPGGDGGLNFSVAGNEIAKYPSFTNTPLSFNNKSVATLPTPIYPDAGNIRLRAYYQADDVTLFGSSNMFWVSPVELVINAKSGGFDLDGATVSAIQTHAAGKVFDLNVTALNSLGVITQNYSPGQMQLMLTRTAPLAEGVDGDLNYAASSWLATSTTAGFQDVTLTDFSSGVSAYTTAHYSEVGLLILDVQDSSYGNESLVIPAEAINLGRFIPNHFKQTVVQQGLLHASCNLTKTFTSYSGQREEAANAVGAISYSIQPVLAITAYNQQGEVTQNYHNDYMKLSGSGISISAPTSDQTATGVDGNQLPLTANMYTGDLSQNDLTTAEPLNNSLPRGVLHYQLSANDNFFYNRSANARVSPFTSDMVFSVATIRDEDSVEVTNTADVSPVGVKIRLGRLALDNSSGPEIYDIPQQMRLEYFNGTGFVVSSDDSCASYDSGKIELTRIPKDSLDPADTSAQGGIGNFSAGKTQDIVLKAPGNGKQGGIGVLYDAYDWLKYDWDDGGAYDDNPSAVATFGIRKGNDGIIYQTSK